MVTIYSVILFILFVALFIKFIHLNSTRYEFHGRKIVSDSKYSTSSHYKKRNRK